MGAGATFSPEGNPSGLEAQAGPARVLIVEDEYFVSMELETILLDMRHEVIGIAATGEEAIKLAEHQRPDLILTDIRLAGSLDGIDAAGTIYTRLGIRSLYVTAHSDPQTRQRAEKTNPLGWVSKPFTSHQLTTAIQMALKTLSSEQ
jgi:DNA-binding NarL/FixJ family response regulator